MHQDLLEPCKQAWVAMLLAHSAAHRVIDAAMRNEGLPSLEVYDVLLALEMAPERRLRMVDLAESVIYSPSGLTRLVDRMEREGLVARSACPEDRRAIYVTLTKAGEEARSRSWPRYAELIQTHFGKHLSEAEANIIAQGLSRVSESENPLRKRCSSD